METHTVTDSTLGPSVVNKHKKHNYHCHRQNVWSGRESGVLILRSMSSIDSRCQLFYHNYNRILSSWLLDLSMTVSSVGLCFTR